VITWTIAVTQFILGGITLTAKRFFLVIILSLMLVTACNKQEEIHVPAIKNENSQALEAILSWSKTINELYYEEVPAASHYSGGIKIENTAKVWLKDNILRTEQITHFYKDDSLIDSEITGEIYDYPALKKLRYYTGKYPGQVLKLQPPEKTLVVPREQTVLWYLDRIEPDVHTVLNEEYEGKQCFIVEILKNDLGSTKVWICPSTKLPVKIVNSYNGNTSERKYCNFKIGNDSVSDQDLKIPKGAIQY